MKKIALAIENFTRHAGGAESYVIDLSEALWEDGWEVHCYGRNWEGESKKVIFHQIDIPQALPTWLKMLLFVVRHKQMVQKEGFDVILGFGNTITMNAYQSHGGVHWYSAFRKSFTESNPIRRILKQILMILTPKHHVRQWIESAAFRQHPLPKIIAISEMIKDDFLSYYKIDPAQVELVYNGIDHNRFDRLSLQGQRQAVRDRLGITERDVVFLFVSFELKKKGIEPLIRAVEKLRNRAKGRIKLLVVGGRPYRSLKRVIKDLGLRETVLFTGPSKSVQEMYAAADVFVLPTYYDACSLVVLEAMACGLPAITTETNGIAGILSDGVNGFVLSHPPRADELLEKMSYLLDNKARTAMADLAQKLSLNYSKTKNHQAMLAIMNEIAAGQTKR